MNRLTERGNQGNEFYPECFKRCDGVGSSSDCDKCDFSYSICERLTAYEDTGLTPEEIQCLKAERNQWELEAKKYCAELGEMKIAEAEGKIVRLPCKVGDAVFMLTKTLDIKTGKLNSKITKHIITQLRGNKFNPIWYIADCGTYIRDFHPSQIGKSVFLTKEEAEKALKGSEGE